MNGGNGHSTTDVLYIAFPGSDAVPGANGADWGASSAQQFESSIQSLGDKLIQRVGDGSVTSTGGSSSRSSSCSWMGHCASIFILLYLVYLSRN